MVSDAKRQSPPEAREIGMVFQEHALFPHLTVKDNITFGLKGMAPERRLKILEDMLRLIQLENLGERYPHELSGGQRQRVALARALAPNPDLLLMDEPFANLDAELRLSLAGDVKRITSAQGISTLLVTHDQHEAFAMADRIAVMNEGRVEQIASPEELYRAPDSKFVAGFIGESNLLSVIIIDEETLDTPFGQLKAQIIGKPESSIVDLLIRPEAIRLDSQSPIRARIIRKQFKGAVHQYYVQLTTKHSKPIKVQHSQSEAYSIGDEVGLSLETDNLRAFA